MLTVLMVAVLAGVAFSTFGNTQDSARKLAIDGDATMLNKAVQAYQGNGGSLTGVTAPADVIAKLKTKPLAAQEQQIAGMKGPFVDLRLELVRAVAGDPWSLNFDAVTSTFKVTEGHGGYVPRITESLAEEPVATEARTVSMPLAKTERWVWDYTNRAAPERSSPTRPSGQITSPTTPVNPAGPTQALSLLPPTYSQPGFQLGPMDFPQLVSLQNPNPSGASEIFFRMNGGPWTKYTEPLSLPLQASTKIEAYTSPIKQQWGPSSLATEIFTFLPGQLTPPVIAPAGGSFAYDEFPKTVTLQDTNPASTARLQYRIGEEAWVNYNGPVPISPEASVKFTARAIPLDSQRWVTSTEVIAIYDLTQELLKSPVFSLAAGMYPATDYPLNISLTNPNPANSFHAAVSREGRHVAGIHHRHRAG